MFDLEAHIVFFVYTDFDLETHITFYVYSDLDLEAHITFFVFSDFDLEAHIASLPICHIQEMGKKPVKVKGQGKIRHHSDSSALHRHALNSGNFTISLL